MRTILKYSILFVILGDIFLLAGFGMFVFDVSTPAGIQDSRLVVIENDLGLLEIANVLKKEGLIRNTRSFIIYAVLGGKASGMQAGIYDLSPAMTTREIADIISKGNVIEYRRVTVPEGYTSRQVADLLESSGVLENKQDFLNLTAMSPQTAFGLYEYDFLKNINAASLEGFLFPDTYEFHVNSTSQEAMSRFLSNFSSKTPHLFNEKGMWQAAGYSPYEILIVASLLEKEVQKEEDMKLVAGVLYNRLNINMPLQVDATLIYLTGKKSVQITADDKQIESPFNTYKYSGLPPAPISNPGLKAINSAINPASTEYMYYLSALDGITHFANTLEEHNENINLYLR